MVSHESAGESLSRLCGSRPGGLPPELALPVDFSSTTVEQAILDRGSSEIEAQRVADEISRVHPASSSGRARI